jgi:hypothetical protein
MASSSASAAVIPVDLRGALVHWTERVLLCAASRSIPRCKMAGGPTSDRSLKGHCAVPLVLQTLFMGKL